MDISIGRPKSVRRSSDSYYPYTDRVTLGHRRSSRCAGHIIMMKPGAFLLLLAAAVPAFSTENTPTPKRQSLETITDMYLFSLPLPQFTAKRDARDPAALDWTSDNCTLSPDNPLGFPFVPACRRHDFGYRNYRRQNRFTVAAKRRIDDKLLAEFCTPPLLQPPYSMQPKR